MSKPSYSAFVLPIVSISVLAFSLNISGAASAETCKVTKVVDGDSVHITCGSELKKVRLCGIDAPELKRKKKAGQPYSAESTKLVKDLLARANNEVTLTETGKDRYGRTVAEIFMGSTFLNAEIVKAGLAYEYKKYSKSCPHREQISEAEAIAQSNKSGLWDGGSYQNPAEFRHQK
jgi:micrococcal nuclease